MTEKLKAAVREAHRETFFFADNVERLDALSAALSRRGVVVQTAADSHISSKEVWNSWRDKVKVILAQVVNNPAQHEIADEIMHLLFPTPVDAPAMIETGVFCGHCSNVCTPAEIVKFGMCYDCWGKPTALKPTLTPPTYEQACALPVGSEVVCLDVAAEHERIVQERIDAIAIERDRLQQDSIEQAKAINRLASAAEDRNIVDKNKEEFFLERVAAAVKAARAEALRDLADKLEVEVQEFVHENFSYDQSTGAWETRNVAKEEWVSDREELIERIRDLVTAESRGGENE